MALVRDEEKDVAPVKAQGQFLRNAQVVCLYGKGCIS